MHVVIEVRIKVEFLELSQKAFRKMKQLWIETSTNGELSFIKRPKKPGTESSKITRLSRMFFFS